VFYIDNTSLDPHYNLALEEYVLKNLDQKEGFILLWQNTPSVIIGRLQNTLKEVNLKYARKNSIPIVRRPSGGGAVYHDLGNLNFSVIVSEKQKTIDFRRFMQPIVTTLSQMGIKAECNQRNDILIDGKKISGNAQYHFRNKTLHHGTILFDSCLDSLQKVLEPEPLKIQSKSLESVRSQVTNVADYLDQKPSVMEFKEQLLYNLLPGGLIQEYKLSKQDQTKIEQLKTDKYLTWEWNYGHSPPFILTLDKRLSKGVIEVTLAVNKGVIQECNIFCDFCDNEMINNLAQSLQGLKYREKDLIEPLNQAVFFEHFKIISKNEFLEFLMQSSPTSPGASRA